MATKNKVIYIGPPPGEPGRFEEGVAELILNEIYTAVGTHEEEFQGRTLLYLVLEETGPDNGYYWRMFRKVDDSFGEEIAQSIEQEINEEELVAV